MKNHCRGHGASCGDPKPKALGRLQRMVSADRTWKQDAKPTLKQHRDAVQAAESSSGTGRGEAPGFSSARFVLLTAKEAGMALTAKLRRPKAQWQRQAKQRVNTDQGKLTTRRLWVACSAWLATTGVRTG